jgi:hypothetical protein
VTITAVGKLNSDGMDILVFWILKANAAVAGRIPASRHIIEERG